MEKGPEQFFEMTIKPLSVGIIGGGIGGLSLAIALRKSNIEVTLFERSKAFEGYGAGVQLSSNGVKVLRYLGLEQEIERKSTKPEKIILRKAENHKIISKVQLGDYAMKRYADPFHLIHRNDLIRIFASRAIDSGVKCFLGAKANICEVVNGSCQVIANGKKFDFDVIVGADGVNSITRYTLLPTISKPKFLKQVAYRATVPFEEVDKKFVRAEINLFLGSGCHLVTYPLVSKSAVNLVFCKDERFWKDARWSISAEKSELMEHACGFYGIEDLISNARELRKWGLFGYENNEIWSSGNVVFLGDSCHPMLPYLAQGANQALEDARALAHFITENNGLAVKDCFKKYENNRRKRVERVQKAATINGLIYHLYKGPVRMIAHASLSLVTKLIPNLLITKFDWLYKYEFKVKS